MDSTRETQLKLYYLFLNADGRISSEESDKFDSICDSIKIGGSDRQEIKGWGKNAEGKSTFDILNMAKRLLKCEKEISFMQYENGRIEISMVEDDEANSAISNIFGNVLKGETIASGGLVRKPVGYFEKMEMKEKAETIWTLISLAYSDDEYSEAEKTFIRLVSLIYKFDKKVMAEFIDTADTMQMLEDKKDWIKKSGKAYDEITDKLKAIDDEIKSLYRDVQITIDEIDAA